MMEALAILLRVAGGIIMLIAALHVPIGRRLKWREEASRMSPVNSSVFRVHAFFICLALVMMALPCLVDPQVPSCENQGRQLAGLVLLGVVDDASSFPMVCFPERPLAR